MRYLPIIAFILAVFTVDAQVRDDRINLPLLYYDLTENKLDFSEYELYLSAMIAIGDKSIVLEEVFKNILQRPDYHLEDSLFEAWADDISKKDISRIEKLPQLTDNWRETVFRLVRVSYMCEAYMTKTTLSDAYLKIMEFKPGHFPHLPPETSQYSSKIIKLVEKYYRYTVWFREYPNELYFFLDLIRDHARTHYGKDSDEDVIRFINHVIKDARDRKSTDIENIPASLDGVFGYYHALRRKQITNAELCNPDQIDEFVANAYDLIYGEAIPEGIKMDLLNFIRTNDVYDAELIYLSLIMSYYE